jgi:hypothetical protein
MSEPILLAAGLPGNHSGSSSLQNQAEEKHFSVNELAALWNLDPDTIRPYFRNRTGVLKIARPETRRKRGYVSLRIPASVAAAVHAELARA